MIDFNNLVKIMGRKGGKVIFKQEIYSYIDPECKPEYQSFVDKMIYRLRAEGYIFPLKSGVYIILDEDDKKSNSVDLLDTYYLALLKKYITEQVGSQYYISGRKSLEFHMKDYSIPKKISIINKNINKKIKIGEYEIFFKTISGTSQAGKKNIFSFLYDHHTKIICDGYEFKISGLELALLESCLIEDSEEGISIETLSKALKKYRKVFQESVFREIGQYKYNMSFNRLKELSRHIAPELSHIFLDIIKKNGGCFVGEGLRNM